MPAHELPTTIIFLGKIPFLNISLFLYEILIGPNLVMEWLALAIAVFIALLRFWFFEYSAKKPPIKESPAPVEDTVEIFCVTLKYIFSSLFTAKTG